MSETDRISAKALYAQLSTDRDPYLKRARRAAELTVPYLMPPDGSSGSTDLKEPSQGLGARGVRHLSSKLQMSLFPVNQPFFKYEVDELALATLTQGQDGQRGEVDKSLSARERAVLAEMNTSMFRPVSFESCRQLIVSGNYLLHIPRQGRTRGFRLDSYVVRRDGSGTILDIVVKEAMARASVPDEIREKLSGELADVDKADPNEPVDLYTKIQLDPDTGRYTVTQEIEEVELDTDAAGDYPADKLEWVPLRFTALEGEDYGRGYVDEFIGDLNSLDVLVEALRDGTVQAAKVIWMVNPNSTVSVHRLSRAENGSFVQGEEGAVRPLRLDKHADFAVAERFIATLVERLSFAFMLHSAAQRDGERVTAEEIRYMASELDMGLGGVYSLQSEEFQLPVARLFEVRMEKARKVPPLPKELSQTTITTGLDALGRGHDLQNLDALIGGASQVAGPEAVARYLNVGEYFKRRGAALGIQMDGLIRSEEEIQAAEQAAQMQAMAQHLGPQAISQMGGAMRDQMKQGEQPDG